MWGCPKSKYWCPYRKRRGYTEGRRGRACEDRNYAPASRVMPGPPAAEKGEE